MLIAIFISGYLVNKLGVGWDRIAGAISCAVIGLLLYLMFTASSVTLFITYQTIVLIYFICHRIAAGDRMEATSDNGYRNGNGNGKYGRAGSWIHYTHGDRVYRGYV